VEITLKNGLFYHWTTRAIAYGGVLSVPGPEGTEALKLLLQAYRRKMQGRILFTELRNLFDLGEMQPVLKECNFPFEEHMNFLIDLDQSEEMLWHCISKSGRQSVRTSGNKGTSIEEITDRSQLRIAYNLLQNVYTRVRVPLAHISLFEAAYDILGPREMFKGFLARAGDHIIGTCFILIYNRRIIDWYAGSDRAFSSHCSGDLLIWHILKWSKEHGLHVFDFGGAGKPGEEYGPRDFKAKFGGAAVYYGRNLCIHSPVSLQISKQIYFCMRSASLFRSPDP
jgi:serine/alanine adding enzyme